MKKIAKYFIVFSLTATFTACNGTPDKTASTPARDPSPVTQPVSKSEKDTTRIKPSSGADTTENPVNSQQEDSQSTKDWTSLIPEGWHVLEKNEGEPVVVEGDLNKDGIPDIAAIIEKKTTGEEAPPRALLIAFGHKDNSYTLSIIADKVILRADEGGVWGDPFENLSIDRGSVVISDYGGSNWRWYNKYRFRYQDNDWYLIGATMGSYFTGTTTRENADEEDYNLLTGDYIIRTTGEDGKVKITKGNRGKKKLVKMSDFKLDDM